jgi:hypothetical protein
MISAPSFWLTALRLDAVAQALAHLAALAVDGEAVRQQAAVGRAAVQRAGQQQRAVEPAAVLVVAFQVQVGLGAAVVAARVPAARVRPRSTCQKVEPESNHTSRMSLLLV